MTGDVVQATAFDVEFDAGDGLDVARLTNHGSHEEAEVIGAHGAVLSKLVLAKGGEPYSVLEGFPSRSLVHADRAFRSAWLLPFPNRIGGGKFTFGGQAYALPLNYPHEGHAIHGLLHDQPFQRTGTSVTRDSASVTLTHAYRGSRKGFPFYFDAKICYKLNNGTGLTCTAEVVNAGDGPMPLGIGWHPYLTLGKPINGLRLRIPGARKVVVGPDMIPTGAVTPFSRFVDPLELGDQMLDDTFEVDVSNGTVGTDLVDPEEGITVQVWQECHRDQFRYVHVYTSPDRKSVAVEPMTCWANAFNNQHGLIVLRSGESARVRCGIRIF